nr:Ig-like domain-containing protein [Bacillus infantis]
MTPENLTVKVGESVKLPATVTAMMSDGRTKEVSVDWDPNTINTDTPGTKTAVGTVKGYNGTVTFTVVVEEVEKEDVRLFLFKDSNSASNSIAWDNISNFHLKNVETGEEVRIGASPSNRDDIFEMPKVPEGVYTIHFDYPDGMYVHKIILGDDTEYNSETNPLVVQEQEKEWEKVYVDIVIKSETTLKEIKPLEDLSVPTTVTYNEFKEILPQHTTILDSNGKEHQVDLDWDVRPFQFESYKKPGSVTLNSEFFELPVSVSNTDPAKRLKVTLKVNFEEEKIVSLITPETLTVNVGDEVELPATVTAMMSNESTKDVPVDWEPGTIDTSAPGTVTAVGTVEGYSGNVTFTVVIEAVETGEVQISLTKDSDKVNFNNITEFYLKNKATGKVYREGKTPSQSTRKNQFEMKDLPEGEYTIHIELPEGMNILEIQLGEAYKETVYEAETNPLVISSEKKAYAEIAIKAEHTLAEIKPLEDLTVSKNITLEEFKAALPKYTTILDTAGKEHQVNLKWDIRPANLESHKKKGKATLYSELFTLPISVSNTDPATRLEVTLKVTFE